MPLSYSQFKEAISFCQNDGLVRDNEAYLLYLIAGSLPSKALALEIGCWKGKSAIATSWGLKTLNGHLHTVDNFAGIENGSQWGTGQEVKEAFYRNTATAGDTELCTLHDMSSQNFSNQWKQEVDFLFVDGCHLYDAARFDIFAFMKFVKPGGWVAFHDVRMRDSVIRAMFEFLEQDKTWSMEALAWDNNLLALKRASHSRTAKPRWQLKLILWLVPFSCCGIPPASQPFQKFGTKLAQSLSRFLFRRISWKLN